MYVGKLLVYIPHGREGFADILDSLSYNYGKRSITSYKVLKRLAVRLCLRGRFGMGGGSFFLLSGEAVGCLRRLFLRYLQVVFRLDNLCVCVGEAGIGVHKGDGASANLLHLSRVYVYFDGRFVYFLNRGLHGFKVVYYLIASKTRILNVNIYNLSHAFTACYSKVNVIPAVSMPCRARPRRNASSNFPLRSMASFAAA